MSLEGRFFLAMRGVLESADIAVAAALATEIGRNAQCVACCRQEPMGPGLLGYIKEGTTNGVMSDPHSISGLLRQRNSLASHLQGQVPSPLGHRLDSHAQPL